MEYYRDTEDSRQVRTEVMKDNLDILVVRDTVKSTKISVEAWRHSILSLRNNTEQRTIQKFLQALIGQQEVTCFIVLGTSCMDSPCDPEQSILVLHSCLLHPTSETSF